MINTSGQVFTLGTITKTCANGKFTMVANSKPIALDLNDSTQVTYSGIVGVPYDDDNVFLNTAPQIQVLNADGLGYTIYYYLTDAWIEDDGTGNEAFVPGWADGAGVYVTEAIPVGKGFWVKATTGEFSINFVQ